MYIRFYDVLVITLLIIDMFIAVGICAFFNISNIVIIPCYTCLTGDITIEVVIFMVLALIEAIIIDGPLASLDY